MENQPAGRAISGSPSTDMSGQGNPQGTQTSSGSVVPVQIRDTQESLHVLKNQIAFAQQCLGLLNNQMKHAEDTLGILQDQIAKAEETIHQIGVPLQCATSNKEHNSIEAGVVQSFRHIPLTHKQNHPHAVLRDSPLNCHGRKIVVHERAGQQVVIQDKEPVMTLSKNSPTAANSVCRQASTFSTNSVPCSCPNCSDVVIIEKGDNVVSTDAAAAAVIVNVNKPVAHERDKCEAGQAGETSKFGTREVLVMSQYAANTANQGSQGTQGRSAPEVEEVQSTSPMASQLLQVIDVLQSAADDEPKLGCVLTPSTPLSAASTHSSGFVYTVPPPESGTMQMASYAFPRERTPRKSRKQTSSPQISPTVRQLAGTADQDNKVRHYADLKELMIVPQPVLASTLEPEFIVVPSSGGMASPVPPPEDETVSLTDPVQQSSSSDRDESTRTTPSSDIKQEPLDSPGTGDNMPRCVSAEAECVKAAESSTKSGQALFMTQPDETSTHGKSRKQKFNECLKSKSQATTKSSLLNQPFTTVQSHSTTSFIQTTEDSPSSSPSLTASSRGSMLTSSRSADSTNGVDVRSPTRKATAGDVQTFPSNYHCPVSVLNAPAVVTSSRQSLAVTHGVETQEQNSSQLAEMVAQSLSSLPFVVTANTVASTKTTPSPRRPNILSRKRDKNEQKNSMPEGLVVLVPTLEDAKKLISSTGRQGRTPVLVPEHLAQSFQNVDQTPFQETNDTQETANSNSAAVSTPNKRIHQSPLNTPEPAVKRRNIEPVLLE